MRCQRAGGEGWRQTAPDLSNQFSFISFLGSHFSCTTIKRSRANQDDVEYVPSLISTATILHNLGTSHCFSICALWLMHCNMIEQIINHGLILAYSTKRKVAGRWLQLETRSSPGRGSEHCGLHNGRRPAGLWGWLA